MIIMIIMRPSRIILFASLILFIECHHLPASPANSTALEPRDRIDYEQVSLNLINDFVMLTQTFITCSPSGPLAPMLMDLVRMSCLFQMLSTFCVISLNILEGWDRLDESKIFKIQMRRTFNNWAAKNEKRHLLDQNVNRQPIKDWVRVLDIHFDMYVSTYRDMERNGKRNRVLCASIRLGQKSLIGMPFEQEICVTKKGVRKLGENRFSTLSINTTRRLVRFLINGGLLKTANNPPFYLFKLMKTYGDMTIDFLETLQEMMTLLQIQTDNSLEKACYFHEGENLLISIKLRRPKFH